jgi:putative hydrolase of the HAD superfamily
MADRLILWDFDGTLAAREGLWSGCVVELLDELSPGHGVRPGDFRRAMSGGYPWSTPDVSHPHLGQSDAWWAHVSGRIATALTAIGIDRDLARETSLGVRRRFIDHTRAWSLFDDTLPALERAAAAGWRSAILSNHVPELPELVRRLGLDGHVERTFTSALTGFEKPHPEAFAVALSACGNPPEVWMVGDNPVADVDGAEAAGIPAVLVRTHAAAPRAAAGLDQALELIFG